MFCKNCGANIPDTAKFCKECGTPVVAEPEAPVEAPVETPVEAPVETPVEAPAEEAPAEEPAEISADPVTIEEPVKKKSKAKPIIITVAIIVAVLGTLVGLLIGLRDTYKEWGGPFPYIANFVDKICLDDKEYGEKVAKNAVEGGIDTIKNKLNEVTSNENTEKKQINLQNLGATAKTKIEVDGALLDLLEQAAGVDLSFLKSVEIVADVDSASNAAKVALEAKLNDKSIAKLSALADYENTKAVYLTLPDLSDGAVKIPLPEDEMAELEKSTEELKAMLEKIDVEAAANVIVKVIEVAMEQVDEDNYETKDEKLTVEGVSVNATKVVIKIDEKMIQKVAVAVVKELGASEDLKKVMKGIYELSGETDDFDAIWDEMKETFEETADMIDEVDLSEMNIGGDLAINLWVDGKGEIIGFGAEAEVEDVKAEFRAVTAVNGKDEGLELSVNVDVPGMEEGDAATVMALVSNISFSGKGTRTDGKLTGEYAIKAGDKSFVEFSVENLSETGGTYTIKLGKGLKELMHEEAAKYLGDAAIKLTVEGTDATSKMAIEVIYGNTSLVKLTSEITLRDLNKDFSIKADSTYSIESESDMMKFLQTIDVEKLMESIEKAGIPLEDLMGMVGDLDDLNFGTAEESVEYPNYDYEYEYDYGYGYDEEEAKQQASENVEYYDYAA